MSRFDTVFGDCEAISRKPYHGRGKTRNIFGFGATRQQSETDRRNAMAPVDHEMAARTDDIVDFAFPDEASRPDRSEII
jgi:hypothetical protein